MSQSSNHAKTRKISAMKVGEGEACRARKAHSTRLGFIVQSWGSGSQYVAPRPSASGVPGN